MNRGKKIAAITAAVFVGSVAAAARQQDGRVNAGAADAATPSEIPASTTHSPNAVEVSAGDMPGVASDGRTVTVVDPVYGEPAYTMRIPAGWSFQATVLRNPDADPGLVFRTASPDGLTGAQQMPDYESVWTTISAMAQSYRFAHVPVMQSLSAADFIRNVVLKDARPGAQAGPVSTLEGSDKLQQQVAEMNARLASTSRGSPIHASADGARMRIQYDYNGHALEENVATVVMRTDIPLQSGATFQTTHTTVTAIRAPRGQLDAKQSMLVGIFQSIKADPTWTAKLQAASSAQNARAMQQIQANQDQLMRQSRANLAHNKAIFDQSMASAATISAAGHASAMGTVEHMGDVQSMIDPTTGRAGQVSNQYSYSYSDQDGRVIHTNSPTYDPSAVMRGTWAQLQPIKPQ